MKNFKQTKKAKEEYDRTSVIALLMANENPHTIFTKEELMDVLGVGDRAVRKQIEELANHHPVIALSSAKGYRVLSVDENTDSATLVQFLDLIEHQLNDYHSRIINLKARMKPLVALHKVIKKKLGN